MKFYLHIPKLEEFALYAACDGITLHGTAGFKQMPRPLYYRAIITFKDKYGAILTVKKLYDLWRGDAWHQYWFPVGVTVSSSASICFVDHVGLDSGDGDVENLSKLFLGISPLSGNEYYMQCIHHFAHRCREVGEYEIMTKVMSAVLRQKPFRCIRELLIQYGGQLHHSDMPALCGCGMHDRVMTAQSHGVRLNNRHMTEAVNSGDIDTIKLVANALSKWSIRIARINSYDLDVHVFQHLLSLGVIHPGHHYHIENIRSIHILNWLLDHDMLDLELMFYDIVLNAAQYGGPFIEVLHYVVEDMCIPMPKDILSVLSDEERSVYDLGVLDYLIYIGAGIQTLDDDCCTPLLLRYWLDKGLVIHHPVQIIGYYIWGNIGRYNIMPATMIEKIIDMLHADVNEMYYNYVREEYEALLHLAYTEHRYDVMDMLIRRGGDLNAVNMYGQTVLHLACEHCDYSVIESLLSSGADMYCRDDNYWTAYDCTHDYDIRRLFQAYGYVDERM